MSYEPTTWKKGDKVTSTKLNKIEQGIQGNDSEVSQLKEGLSAMSTASASDVGRALKAKTITDGKVVEWEFGETGVAVDPTLSIEGKAADAKATGDKLSELKEGLSESVGDLKSATSFNLQHNIDAYINRGMNLYNSEAAVEGYLTINTGAIISSSDYRTSDYIRIENGKSYTKRINLGGLGKSAGAICLYDSNGKFIKNVNVSAISGETDWFLYTANDIGELNGATYIRFSTAYGNLKCFFGEGTEPLATIPEYEFSLGPDGTIDYSQVKNPPDIVEVSNNLLDPESIVNGHMTTGGKVNPHESFITSDFMPVTPGTTYLFHINPEGMGSAAGRVWLYNSDKTYNHNVLSVPVTGNENWYSISVVNETDAYARVSSRKNIVNNTPFCFFEGNTIPDNIPEYGTKYLNPEISVNYSQIVNVPAEGNYDYKSALTGKVWYALGDSATHGDGAITLTEGIYAGQLGVYPFYIGNRTGMIVHNLAVNGAVMATISDKPDRYQWSVDGHYDSVGSDADYITMWIGANDMWQSVPIGTIDSSDPTTFYGAYNKVLTYYVNNFPKAKIGIVASFWCTAEYAEAVIAIGAKYGVPVLNLYNDPSRPVTVGSKRPDVATTVKTTRNNQWIVGNGNTHPSSEYHEIESYFIEEWLKTL